MTNLVLTAVLSAYCHCAACCGKRGKPTAAGVRPERYVSIAAPRWVPIGTRVHVEGLGWRTVHDRTALKWDGRFDVFVGSDKAAHRRAQRLGIRTAKITIIR
jgi:3D (Asp-Asp-Asp) domain-containing protein